MLGEGLNREASQILAIPGTDCHGTCFLLAVTDYQQVGYALQRMFADFKADLLVSQVGIDPKPLIFQGFGRLTGKFRLPIGDV